ncbi:MAG: hypothetical protein WC052_05520 [Patescibacteria group bacterium]|jgi:dTDP-4-dehydrorhamnose 3,5-epimerase-like enzyme
MNLEIAGLVLTLNKRIRDDRGFLGELLPGGTDNALAENGIKNIYLSVATGAFPRAGHYHHEQIENFFPITGSVIWAFKDFREASPTFGVVCAVVVTKDNGRFRTVDPKVKLIDATEAFIGLTVPAGVYHVYWPLFGETSETVCVASTPYNPADYVNIIPDSMPDIVTLVKPIVEKA